VKTRRILLWVLVATSAGWCAWTAAGAASAGRDRAAASSDVGELLALAADLRDLRGRTPTVHLGRKDKADVLDSVASSLSSSGLPRSSLTSVTAGAESPLGARAGVSHARQTARVQFDDITVADFLRWAARWQRENPAWIMTAIDITPAKPPATLSPGEAPRARVRVELESVFVVGPSAGSSAREEP